MVVRWADAIERAVEATGGLLRAIGERGLLVIDDVTSILEMDRRLRARVLAALREIHDGHWYRDVGSEGGRRLEWRGRIGIVHSSDRFAPDVLWSTHHHRRAPHQPASDEGCICPASRRSGQRLVQRDIRHRERSATFPAGRLWRPAGSIRTADVSKRDPSGIRPGRCGSTVTTTRASRIAR